MTVYRVCCHVDLEVEAFDQDEARQAVDRVLSQLETLPEGPLVKDLTVVHAIKLG